MDNKQIKTISLSVTLSVLMTLVIGFLLTHAGQPTPSEQAIASYYKHSAETLVSPHSLREKMDRGYHDYIVVDTRAHEDYLKGHISGAVNIDSNLPVEQVVSEFKALDDWKPILIYCYSSSCMNGRKVGHLLAQNDIYVHELTVGYTEWEFYPNTWNYPDEWENLDIENYITRGPEAGEPVQNLEGLLDGCGIEGELSC